MGGSLPKETTIWKFTHPVAGLSELVLPRGAELMHVADQEGDGHQLDFWAHVDPNETEIEVRKVKVFGTGEMIVPGGLFGLEHAGTVVTRGGALVRHVFVTPKALVSR